MASDIAALVADKGFDYLNGPIKTVTGLHTLSRSVHRSGYYLPNAQKITAAVLSLLRR
jgi:pyruvate dehydrogenase E1 component beta subunit